MIQVFRHFFQVLKRFKGAGLLNIVGLSVAFAVFLAIVIQVNYEYSYNASFPKADRIYRLQVQDEADEVSSSLLPLPLFEIIRSEIPELSESCIIGKPFDTEYFTVLSPGGENIFFEEGPAYADTNVVTVFDLEVMAGDYRKALATPDHVFMPWSLAQKFFGGMEAVGKTFLHNGTKELTVAAIYRDVPSNSLFRNYLYSLSFCSGVRWSQWNYDTYYVLPDGTDKQMLVNKLRALDNIAAVKSFEEGMMAERQFEFYPIKELYFGNVRHYHEPQGNRAMTQILLLIGGIILLVAGINLVNFTIALAPTRIKTLNTQKAFGATNGFIRWCVISEAVFFSFLSFVLGTFWCYLLSGTSIQGIVSASLNPFEYKGLLCGMAGISVVLGVLAGCYPAFYMTSFPPALVLKGSQALSPRGVFLRNTVVVFQDMVAVVLIIGVLFIERQLDVMKNHPWGIEKEHVVFFKTNQELLRKRDVLVNELKQHPAVTNMTFASEMIGDVSMQHWEFGATVNGEERRIGCDVSMVAANFLQFFGIRVIEGDTFVSTRDSVVMVNETFSSVYGFNPMGKVMGGMRVGRILKDFNLLPMQQKIRPLIIAVNEAWAGTYFYVRINDAARGEAIRHIRHTIHSLSFNYGGNVLFLDDHLNGLYQAEERLSSLVKIFGIATILIALMGVYGLVLFNAKFKAKEIGVRKVNGATNWQMVFFVNRSFLRMVGLSFIGACPLAWYAVSRWLNGFAYKTSLSVWLFLLAGLIVFAITLLTISWQSWRVANANPVEVLKQE
ncbi:MAG: ABC transporter permease [Odoribacter sp.]|nr:ABC transporter permease [Odoribacter sp.]